MNQAEWDNHWKTYWPKYLRQRDLKRLRVLLRPMLKGKIADIGCGVTDLYTAEHDVTGVDISPECARIMQEHCPTGTWIAADAKHTGLPSSTFDTVVCSHVLEHMFDPAPVIEEMKRIAKPEGNIIIAVPRRSVGADHVHPKWTPAKIEDVIACHLRDATYDLPDRASWVIQGKKTATATVVMVAWSPDPHRMALMKTCVRSLRERTKYPYRWVVVDNGPQEQTDFLKSMRPDVHLLNRVNQRPPVARNQGAGCARTDYIAFVDNDVEFYEDWLADSIAILEKYPDKKLIVCPTNCAILRRNKTDTLDEYSLSTFGGSICWVMRRRAFEEIGLWNEHDSVEDYEYSIRAGMLGYSYIYRDAEPNVKHLGLHKRTFQAYERFTNGRWLPDPGDKRGAEIAKRLLLTEYARQYGFKVFVETGTYKGDTVKAMLVSKLFHAIYSVDNDAARAALAQRRFLFAADWIHCDCADSAQWLPGVLGHIHEPALFWLDAHPSFEQAQQGAPTPILAELRAVLDYPHARDSLILIDDSRYYDGTIPGYPTVAQLEEMVKTKFPDHIFQVESDIIRIHAGGKK